MKGSPNKHCRVREGEGELEKKIQKLTSSGGRLFGTQE